MLASSTLAVGMIFTSSWAESIALHAVLIAVAAAVPAAEFASLRWTGAGRGASGVGRGAWGVGRGYGPHCR